MASEIRSCEVEAASPKTTPMYTRDKLLGDSGSLSDTCESVSMISAEPNRGSLQQQTDAKGRLTALRRRSSTVHP